jgi:hypothetical protein
MGRFQQFFYQEDFRFLKTIYENQSIVSKFKKINILYQLSVDKSKIE